MLPSVHGVNPSVPVSTAATPEPSLTFLASDDVSSSCFASGVSFVMIRHVHKRPLLSGLVLPSPPMLDEPPVSAMPFVVSPSLLAACGDLPMSA